MSTILHSFVDIFETEFQDGPDAVRLKEIIIPIFQRDYAQGRLNPEVNRVRDRFLSSLYDAIAGTPITLDFVYGDIDKEGVMTPLDGQQRLTTLFLLHWYAARKAKASAKESQFLSKFGYETRYSARYFCKELTNYYPSFEGTLSDEIIEQAWFPLDWKKDPTISSMLVMLDAMNEKFKDVDALWDKLRNGAITFYFLPIRDMGLTDELYIKMNSRGKPLTHFEHFKAELERCVQAANKTVSERVMRKIDSDWTDMLWRYRHAASGSMEDPIIDDKFLRYFRFICDVLCYQRGESPQGKSFDEFDLLAEYFTGNTEQVLKNVETMESYFDCWCNIAGYASPVDFLSSFMTREPEDGKIVVYSSNKIDIFEDCLSAYADKSGMQRRFPLNRFVLLYAVTNYLRHRDSITKDEFAKRLRCVNNLIQNSEDEVSDRSDRNRIPAILKQVDAVMQSGSINDTIENSFNVNQIAEEKKKKNFLEKHPDKASLVYALEDHKNLKGQISIVGLEYVDYAPRFASLFSCKLDLIDCAMMTIGNYSQQERNQKRHQFASKSMQIAWDKLFHMSANTGFKNTSDILVKLLSKTEVFTNEFLEQLVADFISSCEESGLYRWQYYYVKYDSFRPGSYGKYYNDDVEKKPYMFFVMQTPTNWSVNAYMPYLREADEPNLSMEQRLVYGDRHIICENSKYLLRDNETKQTIKSIQIPQNEDGIDTQDRILLLKNYITSITRKFK